MNKKLLSLAVAAGLASSSASAINLNTQTGGNVYASELTIGSGVTLAGTDAAVTDNNVVVNTGFSISDSTARYMRFDLTGATFATGSVALVVNDSGPGANEVLSTGGAAKDSFVVFEVTASAGKTVGVTNNATLGMPNLTLTAQGPIGIKYQLFDNAVDAVNNTSGSALVTKSGNVATFSAANTTTNTPAANLVLTGGPQLIDVTASATAWEAKGTSTNNTAINTLGDFWTRDATAAPNDVTGTPVTSTVIQSAATVTIAGDFTWLQDLTSGAPDGTYTVGATSPLFLDTAGNNCATSSVQPTALTDTSATFTVGNAADQFTVCARQNGVSAISEGAYTVTYAPTENAGYTDADSTIVIGTLAKNGSTVTLNLALKPGGAFSNFIRVVNTSSITGDVFMTVYNDAGDSASIALSDIAGQTSGSLGGQASTDLLAIADIYNAAVAADATFAHNGGKLRVVIDGEFSTIAAQSITLSTDSTTFTTF